MNDWACLEVAHTAVPGTLPLAARQRVGHQGQRPRVDVHPHARLPLDPEKQTAELNDDIGNWCASTEVFSVEDLGSPFASGLPCDP
jgi:hypothetical protein